MIFRRKLRTPHLYGTQQQRTAQSRCRLSDVGSHDRLAWLRVRQTVNRIMHVVYVFEYQRAYEALCPIIIVEHAHLSLLPHTRRSSASAVRSAALARVRHGHLQPQQKHAVWRLRRRLHAQKDHSGCVPKSSRQELAHLLGNFTSGLFAAQRT